jgi:hypothetical protein
MLDMAADRNPLPSLAACRRAPYQKHHNHPEAYHPIFNHNRRFSNDRPNKR